MFGWAQRSTSSPNTGNLSPFFLLLGLFPLQIYKVLGHINILGDPLSLGKSISSGVVGFMKKVKDVRLAVLTESRRA